ncbi:HD-GYP domain-containing protein [Pseudoxanthomonas composti]|uniref:HD-GYP domain-containing protein n=1 Tax=Pseudoxanthomonas composti TaxID=2137479 RepID=A0A4V1N0W1_9GAMM|nr:HD-GYP domain-containing protein [Pseudoxanthomonas composti]RXR03429.1 HD-GYP domain-containing protein [Pseudoxanthomonas composti]
MLRTIDSAQLQPGMYIHKLLGAWVKHPFWRASFLASAEDVLCLQRSAVEQVVIDTSRGLDVAQDLGAEQAEPPEPETKRDTATDAALDTAQDQAGEAGIDESDEGQTGRAPAPGKAPSTAASSLAAEVQRARRICLDGRETVEAMFRDVRLGRTVDPERAMPLVEQINASVMRHPNALISVARLKTADDYTYLHSMAVAALMSALARQQGLSDEQVLEAAMGGLLHDMGKAMTPLEILNKPGRLTDGEFDVMRRHPNDGMQLLMAAGMDNPAVLQIALHHHEKIDGSGYPHKLVGDDISLMARMGAICDVYDAVTSDRPYKSGWDPAESLRHMVSWKGHFDPLLLQAFVKSLGIYPVGSLVRLASDKLAVVVEQAPGSLLMPRVRAFYSARSRIQILIHDIDLATPGCQDRIVNIESPAQWGFKSLEKLWLH